MSQKTPVSFEGLQPHEVVEMLTATGVMAQKSHPDIVRVSIKGNRTAILIVAPVVANSSGK